MKLAEDQPVYWQFIFHDVATYQVQNNNNPYFSEHIAYSMSLESFLQITQVN